jgi:DNA polymerase-3 subunit epsilon
MDTVKQAIQQHVPVASLRALADGLGLLGVDRRSRRSLGTALAPIATEELLDLLDKEDLQHLALAMGRSAEGRRDALVKRILGADGTELGPIAGTFVAIDFETADNGRDSACAVALVRAEGGRITARQARLIRPPRHRFLFTHIHGITWAQVAGEPTFGEVWPTLVPLLRGVDFLAAHNASFDRSVLRACCGAAGLELPRLPWACTVKLSREQWHLHPTRLPDVCAYLGLSLNHHDAASDAEACARIMLTLQAERAAPGA